MRKDKVIRVILILVLVAILAVSYIAYLKYDYYTPEKLFKRKFGFELPDSAVIERYEFLLWDEQILTAEVTFDGEDYPAMYDGMIAFFESESDLQEYREFYKQGNKIKYEWGYFEWDDVVFFAEKTKGGVMVKNIVITVFITLSSEGEYMLHFMY